MSAEEVVLDGVERMEKAIQILKHSLGGIRTGRANPGLVDSLRVEVYGAATPIKQLATVGAPDGHLAVRRKLDPKATLVHQAVVTLAQLGEIIQFCFSKVEVARKPIKQEMKPMPIFRPDLASEVLFSLCPGPN